MCEKLLSIILLVWMKGRVKAPQNIVVLCLQITFGGRFAPSKHQRQLQNLDLSIMAERHAGLGRAENLLQTVDNFLSTQPLRSPSFPQEVR